MRFDRLFKQASLFERLAHEALEKLRQLELSPSPEPRQLKELERLHKKIKEEEATREAFIGKVETVILNYIRGHKFQLGGGANQMIVPVSEFLRVFPRGTSLDKAADELEAMGLELEDSPNGGRVVVEVDEWIAPEAKTASYILRSGLIKFSR
jgi:hypothetical protein